MVQLMELMELMELMRLKRKQETHDTRVLKVYVVVVHMHLTRMEVTTVESVVPVDMCNFAGMKLVGVGEVVEVASVEVEAVLDVAPVVRSLVSMQVEVVLVDVLVVAMVCNTGLFDMILVVRLQVFSTKTQSCYCIDEHIQIANSD